MENTENTAVNEAVVKEHKNNLIAYGVTLLLGIVLITFLIPNYIKLKKNADFGPEKFPYIIAGIFVVLGLYGLISELITLRKNGITLVKTGLDFKKILPQLLLLASGFLFVFCAQKLGFIIAAVIFMVFWMWLYGSTRKLFTVLWAIGYSLLLYLLFSKLLGIRFTGGFLNF